MGKKAAGLLGMLLLPALLALAWARLFPAQAITCRIGHILETSSTVEAAEYRCFSHETGKNTGLLTRKVLTRGEVRKLTDCFTPGNEFIMLQCGFHPHHELVCRRFDGTTTSIRICMACVGMSIDGQRYIPIGGRWSMNLNRTLPEIGIPVRDRDFYESD